MTLKATENQTSPNAKNRPPCGIGSLFLLPINLHFIFLLQREILLAEFHCAGGISDDTERKQDNEFPDKRGSTFKNRHDVEQRNNCNVVEIIERFEANDLRNDLTAEQSEHCRDKREDTEAAAYRHSAFGAVERTRREVAQSGQREQNEERAEVDKHELAVSELDSSARTASRTAARLASFSSSV